MTDNDEERTLASSMGLSLAELSNEEPPVRRRARRRHWITAAVIAAVIAVAVALVILPGGKHGLDASSPACRKLVAAQHDYVLRAISLGYPNDDPASGLVILNGDEKLLKAMGKVCPGNTKIDVLPGS